MTSISLTKALACAEEYNLPITISIGNYADSISKFELKLTEEETELLSRLVNRQIAEWTEKESRGIRECDRRREQEEDFYYERRGDGTDLTAWRNGY